MTSYVDLLLQFGATDAELPIAAALRQHLALLHEGLAGWSEVFCIHPTTKATRTLWARCDDPRTLTATALYGARENLLHGYGVYVGVCPRAHKTATRGSEADAGLVPALWVDVDGGSADALLAFSPPPSLVFATGGGWHAYWLLDTPAPASPALKRVLRGLARTVGGDLHATDLARVLRGLGSRNTKPGRGMAVTRIAHRCYHPERRYALAPFWHLAEAAEAPPVRTAPAAPPADVPRWIQEYLLTPPPEGARNATLYRMAATLKDYGWSEAQAGQILAHFAALPEREIAATVHSAYQKPPRGVPAGALDLVRLHARG